VRGACADKVVAFARQFENEFAVTVVPRIASTMLRAGDVSFAPDAWQDTAVRLPENVTLNVFTGHPTAGGLCAVHSLLGRLPIALLV
jgi:(1->4)-alpha-D-glucan 1-alpha-D-glucosylmutase